jgi:tight adherence protein B
VPASQAKKATFGTVLVVDASESMKGKPTAQAVAAEKAFAARRNPNQQLGIIAFNSTPKVLLPLTTSGTKIDAALATPPAIAYGTHIFDALAQAESMLTAAHISAGTVVLLSDGADTGSKTTADAVTATAQNQHIRVYTIGLKSPSFKPHTLESLASVGGGQYALAKTTSDLGPLFDQLGRLLSRDYLLRYKSFAGPKQQVNVAVRVAGVGRANAAYETPALPVHIAPPYKPSLKSRILGSWLTILAMSLIAACGLALLLIAVFEPRRSGLPERMAEFVSVPGLQSTDKRPGGATGEAEAGDATRSGPLARLEETLDIARIDITPGRLIALTVIGTVAALGLLLLATSSGWWALLALLVPFGVRSWVIWKLERRRKAFAEQVPDTLQVISAALRAGQSFAASFAVVVESAGEPMKSEMRTVVADEQLGVPLDKAMSVVVRRMNNRDLEQVALVAELQRESGGNSAEVIDRVAETVRERFELRRLINTLTVQGRMSRWIVTALPIALVGFISLINPHYLHPLVVRLAGKIMIVLAVLLVIGGSLVIKKIVDIKV